MRSRWLASVIVGVGLLSFAPQAAHAWQTVKSGASGTRVLATPTPDGAVSGNVVPGKAITIGDKPTGGFYRCNAGKGLNGWCEETELDFGSKGAPKGNPLGNPGIDEVRNSKWHAGSGALESNMYVGALLGFGFYSAGTKLTFGLDGGYKLGPDWALGLYVTYTSLGSTEAAGISASSTSIVIAPEVNYWLPGELKGMHLGAKIGLNMTSSSASSTTVTVPANLQSASSSGLVFGAAAGYDHPVTQDITVGGEANFLIISGSGSSSTSGSGSSTTTTSSGSSSVFNILVSGKYWL